MPRRKIRNESHDYMDCSKLSKLLLFLEITLQNLIHNERYSGRNDGPDPDSAADGSLTGHHVFIVMIVVLIIMIIMIVVLIIMIFIADKLVGSITRVASVHGAGVFKVVKAFLGGGGQNIVVAVVVGGNEEEEGIAADARAAVARTIVLDEFNVGRIATVIGTVGGGTAGGTFDEGPLDLTGGADLVEIMEIILSLYYIYN